GCCCLDDQTTVRLWVNHDTLTGGGQLIGSGPMRAKVAVVLHLGEKIYPLPTPLDRFASLQAPPFKAGLREAI
ncbi:MAG: hypothetical protein PVI06_21480, partial [Desulfobacterales bacterium]